MTDTFMSEVRAHGQHDLHCMAILHSCPAPPGPSSLVSEPTCLRAMLLSPHANMMSTSLTSGENNTPIHRCTCRASSWRQRTLLMAQPSTSAPALTLSWTISSLPSPRHQPTNWTAASPTPCATTSSALPRARTSSAATSSAAATSPSRRTPASPSASASPRTQPCAPTTQHRRQLQLCTCALQVTA